MSAKTAIPLTEAVISNEVETVRTLLSSGVDVDQQDKIGYTALHYAAQNYLLDIALVLLEHKASVDAKDTYGNTPLFRAVFNSKGRGDMIQLLLIFGADKDSKNNHGVSPIELAKTIANYSIVQFFDDVG
jgi:ankyrin repeat protein